MVPVPLVLTSLTRRTKYTGNSHEAKLSSSPFVCKVAESQEERAPLISCIPANKTTMSSQNKVKVHALTFQQIFVLFPSSSEFRRSKLGINSIVP